MQTQRNSRHFPALAVPALLAALFTYSCAGGPKPVQGATATGTGAKAPVALTPEQKKVAALENADSLLQEGKAVEAVARLDELSKSRPEDSELRLLKAAALASAGRLDEARAETEAILVSEPENLKALAMAINLARFAGDETGRKSLLDRGLAAAPADPGILVAAGQYQLDREDWKRAELYFRTASAKDAQNPDAALGLGEALYKLDRHAEAKPAFDRAVALDPASSWAYSGRAKVRYQLGDFEGALADLDKAISLSPDSSWLRLDRGRMYLNAGRDKEAEADFSRAIAVEPDYFLPYVFRAGLFEENGRDTEALADYRAIIKLEPDYWYAWESVGATSFRLGQWADSAQGFRQAYGYARDNYAYAILAGLAMMRAGKPAEAKAWAASIAPGIDREKNMTWWLMLRLIQDQNDQSAELEARLQVEKSLDTRAAALFYLGEYWIARGKANLGAKYLGLSEDMNREQCLEHRLVGPELKRLGQANG